MTAACPGRIGGPFPSHSKGSFMAGPSETHMFLLGRFLYPFLETCWELSPLPVLMLRDFAPVAGVRSGSKARGASGGGVGAAGR